jgi:hypothetical protein
MHAMLHSQARETYLRDYATAVSTVRADSGAWMLTAQYCNPLRLSIWSHGPLRAKSYS